MFGLVRQSSSDWGGKLSGVALALLPLLLPRSVGKKKVEVSGHDLRPDRK